MLCFVYKFDYELLAFVCFFLILIIIAFIVSKRKALPFKYSDSSKLFKRECEEAKSSVFTGYVNVWAINFFGFLVILFLASVFWVKVVTPSMLEYFDQAINVHYLYTSFFIIAVLAFFLIGSFIVAIKHEKIMSSVNSKVKSDKIKKVMR